VDKETQEQVELALKECEDALVAESLDALKEKTDALQQASMKIGEAVYKGTQDSQGEEKKEGEEKKDDSKDAEYEEKPKK
jgi:molecular chaperone DnaK